MSNRGKTSGGRRHRPLGDGPGQGGSPDLTRNKRKKPDHHQEGDCQLPPEKKMTTNRDDEILKAIGKLATKDDLNKMEMNMRSKIAANASAIARLDKRQNEDRANMETNMNRMMERKLAKKTAT